MNKTEVCALTCSHSRWMVCVLILCQMVIVAKGETGREGVGQAKSVEDFDFGGTGVGLVEMRQCLDRDLKSIVGEEQRVASAKALRWAVLDIVVAPYKPVWLKQE